LKPEKSKQFSFGAVFEPTKALTVSLDYWNVEKTDQIGVIAVESLLSTPALMSRFGSRIKRGADGFILYVETPVDNLGDLKTSGIDLDIRGRLDFGSTGRLNLGLAGTYVLNYDAQKYSGGDFGSFAGTGGDGSVPPVPRWQHTASAEWVTGDTAITLEQVYTRGWTESASSVNYNIGVDAPYNVKDSLRYNMSVAYKGIKDVTARFGIRNLFDQEPPFTASSSYGSHAAGYAASFTDPRGRFFYVNLGYQFK
jgi:iron complex outermembrane receptor protein